MTKRACPADAKKKEEGLKALDYECSMLRATAMALASGIIENKLAYNAFVESFLIHARLLIEFLYESPKKKDDLRPEDWLARDEWSKIRGEKSELLSQTHHDAHKYLCHLTATRLNRKKTWDCLSILREIEAVLQKFFRQIQTVANERARED